MFNTLKQKDWGGNLSVICIEHGQDHYVEAKLVYEDHITSTFNVPPYRAQVSDNLPPHGHIPAKLYIPISSTM